MDGSLALCGEFFNNAILMGAQSDRRRPRSYCGIIFSFFSFSAKQPGTDAKQISLEELIYLILPF